MIRYLLSIQRWLIAISIALAVTQAVAYEFVRITDTSSRPISSLHTSVSINAGGRVAFRAVNSTGVEILFTGAGGALTRIADTSGKLASIGEPDINRFGAVAFQAFLDEDPNTARILEATASGIFVGDGRTLDTVALHNKQYTFFGEAAINDSGKVATVATLTNGGAAVATARPSQTIAQTREGYISEGVDINSSGLVAFELTTPDG